MKTRPNVLFIVADQHNAKVLGCNGHPDVKTPNLDRMAAEGVRFENAITQNPICTPSRVSFFSGQYCHNHGYYGLSGPNPRGLPTLLGHFRRAGYRTSAVGKIHTDWLITTTRPTTVLPARKWTGPQAHTRYRNTVNPDNRIPPDRVRELRSGNYL